MPSADFTHRASATTDPETAWAHLQLPETWASLAGVREVYDVEYQQDGTLRSYRFKAEAAGQTYDGIARTVECEAPHRMVLDIDTSEVGGRITTEITSVPRSVEIEVRVRLRSKGFLSTLFFPIVSQAVGSGLPESVDAFASRLEA